MELTQERIEQERIRTERIIQRRRQYMLRTLRSSIDHLYEAWEEAEKVVLMDVEMPEMDGLEATAVIRVKEKQTDNHLPIIAMTAHAMMGDRDRCLEAGMDDYVSKPIRAQQLFETLESVLGTAASSNSGNGCTP